jgi:glutamate synthase domain-containing protein 3
VGGADVEVDDWSSISRLVEEYCAEFGLDAAEFVREEFIKLYPHTSRPYGKLYTY